MPSTNLNNVKMVDKTLVDKILEQGQKLRNAMVGSILQNDPFNSEVIYSKQYNTPQTSKTDLSEYKFVNNLTSFDEKRLGAFIKGEHMTRDEEKLALDTLRSLSASALYKTTEKNLNSGRLSSCRCRTCELYNANNLYCDLRRKNIDPYVDNLETQPFNEITRDIQDKYKTNNEDILRYVDSLKVSISSLVLNEMGNQKVFSFEDKKVPCNLNQTYFLEYTVPDSLINKTIPSTSKVNSGLGTNHVRLCSRRSNDTINFKQVSIHDVKNFDKLNLEEHNLSFKLSYRTSKQKSATVLGFARFNFGSFLFSKNLACSKGLSVFLGDRSPIVVGTLKVSLQLGCGRLYFGQEFIDAIKSTKRNSVVLDSDDSATQLNKIGLPYDIPVFTKNVQEPTYRSNNNTDGRSKQLLKDSERFKTNEMQKQSNRTGGSAYDSVGHTKNGAIRNTVKQSSYFDIAHEDVNKPQPEKSSLKSDIKLKGNENRVDNKVIQQISESEKQILFGLLYISEAQYLSPPISTYITCRPFCQNETCFSKQVSGTSHPVFNFFQLVPLIFEDDLLHLLRENYMVIEFWRKTEAADEVIGLTKIFLHQFYLAYRNPVILKYLSKNQLPIVGTDWWEPIYRVNSEEVLGQVQVLVALGTEQQINTLKTERGFTSNVVKSKFPFPKPAFSTSAEKNIEKQTHVQNSTLQKYQKGSSRSSSSDREKPITLKKVVIKTDQSVNTSTSPRIQKFDVATQSELKMDDKEKSQEQEKTNVTQEMLGSFLNKLMTQRQRNVFVENSTNTEAVQSDNVNEVQNLRQAQDSTNLELRRTTDLLDSLQKALSVDKVQNVTGSKKESGIFRATVAINTANHLPSRKKCRSKKSRNKSLKNDDNVLPSCYVSFETVTENELKITPVVSKSTTPVWNYRCNVNLPTDLITNNQKRLIFKVWRKSTNTNKQPNMQTDTVLGFAAVDLTVLLAGLPNVQGWFNIIDFSGKCNGQINIHITPLEDLSTYGYQKECNCNSLPSQSEHNPEPINEPEEILSRALKRKFTELDEITQRLRLRLSKVTNEDSDASSDGVADEFENDINTLCIEDDFDLINFEDEARKFNISHSKEGTDSAGPSNVDVQSGLILVDKKEGDTRQEDEKIPGVLSVGSLDTAKSDVEKESETLRVGTNPSTERELASLDKQLLQGKQRIDTLLEKLSLLSTDTNNPFTSRYVSGCSINDSANIDTEAILNELDHNSRPNIQSSSGFNPIVFQQLYAESASGNSMKSSSLNTLPSSKTNSNSDTSLITNFSDCRPAPDGQGTASDEKVGRK